MIEVDQVIFNWSAAVAGGLGMFVLKSLWDANKEVRSENAALAKSIGELNDKINREFVRRDDYRDDIGDIKSGILRIEDKLDRKVDKT